MNSPPPLLLRLLPNSNRVQKSTKQAYACLSNRENAKQTHAQRPTAHPPRKSVWSKSTPGKALLGETEGMRTTRISSDHEIASRTASPCRRSRRDGRGQAQRASPETIAVLQRTRYTRLEGCKRPRRQNKPSKYRERSRCSAGGHPLGYSRGISPLNLEGARGRQLSMSENLGTRLERCKSVQRQKHPSPTNRYRTALSYSVRETRKQSRSYSAPQNLGNQTAIIPRTRDTLR